MEMKMGVWGGGNGGVVGLIGGKRIGREGRRKEGLGGKEWMVVFEAGEWEVGLHTDCLGTCLPLVGEHGMSAIDEH